MSKFYRLMTNNTGTTSFSITIVTHYRPRSKFCANGIFAWQIKSHDYKNTQNKSTEHLKDVFPTYITNIRKCKHVVIELWPLKENCSQKWLILMLIILVSLYFVKGKSYEHSLIIYWTALVYIHLTCNPMYSLWTLTKFMNAIDSYHTNHSHAVDWRESVDCRLLTSRCRLPTRWCHWTSRPPG